MIRPKLLLPLLFVFLPAFGCVSIPKEAPELSAEVGNRIAAFETAHIAMLRSWMDEKRDRLDEFLVREWVPTFAEEVMSEPVIRDTWTSVCASGSAQDRLTFLVKLGPRIQGRINRKRMELMQPLDELEITIERRLRDDYLQAKAMSNAVTSFLVSASRVAENRDRFLKMIGVDDHIAKALDSVDAAVADLVEVRDRAVDREDAFDEFKSKVGSVIAALKNRD